MPARRTFLTLVARGSVAALAVAAAHRAGLSLAPPGAPAAAAPPLSRPAPPLLAEATRVDLTREWIDWPELVPGVATLLPGPWQAVAEVTLSMAALPAWEAALNCNGPQPFRLHAADTVWEWLGLVTEVRMEAELSAILTVTARVQSIGPVQVRQGGRWITLGSEAEP